MGVLPEEFKRETVLLKPKLISRRTAQPTSVHTPLCRLSERIKDAFTSGLNKKGSLRLKGVRSSGGCPRTLYFFLEKEKSKRGFAPQTDYLEDYCPHETIKKIF